MTSSSRRRRLVFAGLFLALAGGAVAAYLLWFRNAPLPAPGSPEYEQYLRAFQVGVAALDTKDFEPLAQEKLTWAVELIPGEPAAWANLGLLYLRKNDFKQAEPALKRAKKLAPASAEVEALLGHLAEKQGRLSEAVAHFRKALDKDANDLPTLYALAQAVRKEGGADSEAEYQRLLEQMLQVQPNNMIVLVKRGKTAAGRKDLVAFRDSVSGLKRLAPGWSPRPRKMLDGLRQAAKTGVLDEVDIDLDQLLNVLQEEPGYNRDIVAIVPEQTFVGSPVRTFLRLPPPRPTPAPPDRELTFATGPWAPKPPVAGLDKVRWEAVRIVWGLNEQRRAALEQESKDDRGFGGMRARPADELKRAVFVADGREVRRADAAAAQRLRESGGAVPNAALAFPGGPKAVAPTAAGVLAFDWDNDLRTDLLLAGAGGLRFYHHEPGDEFTFKDVTAKTGLPKAIVEGDYYGAWAADTDMDGDLDVILARRSGAPLLLRNNRDGTFTPQERFAGVSGARAFVWADFDNDGLPDMAFLDAAGKLHVLANERHGQFLPWAVPANLGTFLALTAADVNDDGVLDLVALRADGALLRLSDQGRRKSWQVAELARWPGPTDLPPGTVSLFAEDLDNNGAVDLVVAGPRETHVFLGDAQGKFERLAAPVPMRVGAVTDLNGDRRLDLLGLSVEGRLEQALNQGKKNYRGHVVWPVPNPTATRKDRFNSFAIGGEVEVRAGSLVQKRPVNGPAVHFGLGEQTGVDVVRVVWPNGVAQAEFEFPGDYLIAAHQRLHGSCPFLFTWDGTAMRFAGDFMWGTPLGMYVNGQNVGDFPQTTEWLKIPGKHLVPRDGYYDVRVHANLWETDYFDQLALIVVDYPPDTEIHVDERFWLTPTPPRLHVTTPARPVARAWDHRGKDATAEVRAIDGRYLDRAGRGKFQGVTQDHWVEADLGDDAPKDGPVLLIARGWLQPTNSSINVALMQGTHDAPRPLVLEIPDGKGGWKASGPPLGFPAGKDKTMLIRLDGAGGKGVSRRVRLRTNMEIYWDFLGWARELDPKLARVQRPAPLAAELRYRGILQMTRKDASSPEVPLYERVSKAQHWRDLTGWYTRFGDVRELLAKVDDRYVIMNAGDEIALRFPVPEPPPAGWQRDFVWECDGWTRDGDPNTRFGTTVLPLPAHGVKAADRPPGRLEDDPVYRRFPQDWQRYHTRYVTPDEFARGLRAFQRGLPRR